MNRRKYGAEKKWGRLAVDGLKRKINFILEKMLT
jgi:hypothetical protein